MNHINILHAPWYNSAIWFLLFLYEWRSIVFAANLQLNGMIYFAINILIILDQVSPYIYDKLII